MGLTREFCESLRDEWVQASPDYQDAVNKLRAAEARLDAARSTATSDPVKFAESVADAMSSVEAAAKNLRDREKELRERYDGAFETYAFDG